MAADMRGQYPVWYCKQGSYLVVVGLAWYWKTALEMSDNGEVVSDEVLELLARVSLRLN